MQKYFRVVVFLFCYIALGYTNVGCMFSIGYHAKMLLGDTAPRPFPIIRYWTEYSKETFCENVLNVPLVGIPGIIPIGYMGDALIDVIFLPIDIVLSTLISEPYVEVKQHATGDSVICLYSSNTQVHYDKTLIKGAIPLKIDVKKGFLTLDVKTRSANISFHIYPKEIKLYYADYYGRVQCGIYSKELKPLTLWCFPKNTQMPLPLFFSLINSKEISPTTSFSFMDEQIDLPYRGGNISQHNDNHCVMSITLSPDFLGECSYNGMSVSEIRFIYD